MIHKATMMNKEKFLITPYLKNGKTMQEMAKMISRYH